MSDPLIVIRLGEDGRFYGVDSNVPVRVLTVNWEAERAAGYGLMIRTDGDMELPDAEPAIVGEPHIAVEPLWVPHVFEMKYGPEEVASWTSSAPEDEFFK